MTKIQAKVLTEINILIYINNILNSFININDL